MQCSIDLTSPFPAFGTQSPVAGAHGQAVLFPHDGAHHQYNAIATLSQHAVHHLDLLVILLAHEQLIGLHDIQQYPHHLGYACKMPGTARSFQDGVQSAQISRSSFPSVIDIGGIGQVEHLAASCFQEADISSRGAGVFFQIGGIVELGGIDENAHHPDLCLRESRFEQREVTFVQCPHGGYKADAQTLISLVRQVGPEVGLESENAHGQWVIRACMAKISALFCNFASRYAGNDKQTADRTNVGICRNFSQNNK